MKDNIFGSFRVKLVQASLYSLICAFLTMAAFIGTVRYIKISIDTKRQQEQELEFRRNTVNTIENRDGTTAERPPESPYEPNEYVNPKDRTYVFTFRWRHRGIIANNIWLDLVLLICLSFVVYILYFLLFTRKMVDYFREVSMGITRIQNGDFETDIRVSGNDEYSMLAESINKMRHVLKDNIETEREVEKRKNELITNVAHDLRTPLTSTIGYLELLRQDAGLDASEKQQYTEVAYKKAKTLETLINDLFDFTRLQKGKLQLNVVNLDIVLFIRQMMEEFNPQIEDAGLKLEMELPDHSIYLDGDGEKLARAFSNLVTNAIKYGVDGKLLKVSVIDLEEQVYVAFTNYGRVIPPENLPYVFDKFYRVEQSRSASTGGTGLGLAIAKNIVLMHDGEISAKSDESGTTFKVCLPKRTGGRIVGEQTKTAGAIREHSRQKIFTLMHREKMEKGE